MLISRIKTYMQVRYTSGRQLSYKDHIINFRQDISTIATRLPRLPEDVDLVIIRQEGTDLEQHVDFMVRREKVRAALEWKIANDPHYADLQLDEDALAQLPESGSVVGRLQTAREGRQDGLQAQGQGPENATAPEADDADDGNSQTVAGVMDLNGIGRTEVQEIRSGAEEVVNGGPRPQPAAPRPRAYEQEILYAPAADPTPLSEITPGYIPMAFPTLFPDGKCDYYAPRARKVELGEYFAHLLKFRGGRFAQHKRFPWFAFNTLQRARTLSKSKIFIRQNHDEAKLTSNDIEELLREGDERIVAKMMRYGEDIRGTRAYWAARRQELIDAMRVKDSPHIFFTLSAADLQWPDLHQHMPPPEQPADTPADARKQRRTALNNNPHIAAAYLDERIKAYLKHFLGPLLDVVDFWYRYEWQERGSGHIHGFLWIRNAPNPEAIDWSLLKKPDAIIPDDQQEKMDEYLRFWNSIITASHPSPRGPEDANAPLPGQHPCSIPRQELKHTKQELSDLLEWVERHRKCVAGYCLVKRKVPGQDEPTQVCRFDFPMPLRDSPVVGLDSKRRLRFEPTRNDPLLNTHNRAMILAWRANIDLKPVLSKESALEYAAKYATKAEKNAPTFTDLLRSVVEGRNEQMTAQATCQKLLNKMVGERAYPAQETAHLLLGIPLVRSSFNFQTLSLAPNGSFRRLRRQDESNPAVGLADSVTEESWIQRYVQRPESLENLSLHDLMTTHTWYKSAWRKKRNTEGMMRTILRVFPRYPPNPQDDLYDEYCRTKIILHHPFRNLNSIREREDQPWAELMARCQAQEHTHPRDTLRCWEEENREVDEEEEDEDLLNPDVGEMTEDDWQTWARLRPDGGNIPMFGLDDLGKRPLDDGWDLDASRNRWNDVTSMQTWIQEQKREYVYQADEEDLKDPDTLAPEQRVIYDQYVDAYAQILAAGCGKTYTIKLICQTLREMATAHGEPEPFRILAPSGVAALNISGSTLHSGLFIPTGNTFEKLKGTRLAALQLAWNGVYFIIIDEKSMVGLKLLAKVDSRCRQIRPHEADIPFGGFHMALIGDFAQLPPVGDTPLYAPPSTVDNENGKLSRDGATLYSHFLGSHQLLFVHRQQGNSPEQTAFRELLKRASDGRLTMDDWQRLLTRTPANLSQEEQRGFDDAVCLFATRSDVHNVNLLEIQRLNNPCARIKAVHEGGSLAENAPSDEAAGLESQIVLSKGAKVMITRNLWLKQGLVNGTVGTVEDIVWAPGASRSDIPLAVLVSCREYKGPTLWRTAPELPNFPNGVPIIPISALKTTFEVNGKPCARTQIPLRLAWAVTIHKSQGLTLKKIKLGLGKKEFSTGLTFVGLSRVASFKDIMIVDTLDYSRIAKLGGKYLQYRLVDYARRYQLPNPPNA
ncbi:hypothetical protein D9611_006665 [Ephemerocybe angulata]|uniref:ATP-dependent DNA helicase n=1 Tax=Ephemerocybe angulata TaxID=980116 RepID=A0A8H5C7A2_9AGAR|nr:hypothetical protein D9611_006665 [Tulosesus angulatus]